MTATHSHHPGAQTPPVVPASTVAATNSTGYPCLVQLKGGTVSVVAVDGVALSLVGAVAFVPAGGTITAHVRGRSDLGVVRARVA